MHVALMDVDPLNEEDAGTRLQRLLINIRQTQNIEYKSLFISLQLLAFGIVKFFGCRRQW